MELVTGHIGSGQQEGLLHQIKLLCEHRTQRSHDGLNQFSALLFSAQYLTTKQTAKHKAFVQF